MVQTKPNWNMVMTSLVRVRTETGTNAFEFDFDLTLTDNTSQNGLYPDGEINYGYRGGSLRISHNWLGLFMHGASFSSWLAF